MLRKTIIAALICAVAGPVWATGGGKAPDQEQHQGQAQGQQQQATGGKAKAVSGAQSSSTALSGSVSQSGAKNVTTVDASNGVELAVETGGVEVVDDSETVQTVTTDDDLTLDIRGDHYEAPEIPVATAVAPQPWTHIRCGSVLGGSWQGENGAGALGVPIPRFVSRQTRDCERENDAAWLESIGLRADAIRARCAKKSMQERFGADIPGLFRGRERTDACIAHLTKALKEQGTMDGLRGQVTKLEDQLANERAERAEAERRFEHALQNQPDK